MAGGTEVGKAYVSTELNTDALQSQMTGLGGLLGSKFGPVGQLLGNLLGQNLGESLSSKAGVAGKLGEALGASVSQGAAKGVEDNAPQAEQAAGKLAGVFGATGPWGLAAGAAVAGAAAIGVGLYKLGGDFESNYRTIARNTGDTGKQLNDLKKAFNDVLAATPASMGQVATTIEELQRYTGATSPALETLSKQLITVSRISGTDVATNVQAATHALENWNIPTKQAPALMDALYTVSQKSGASFASLAAQVTKFGPQMRLMGFSFTQSAAMIGTFDKAGVNSQQLMMGLGMAATKLAKTRETADLAVTTSQAKLTAAVAKADTTTGKAHITAMTEVTKAQDAVTAAQQKAATLNTTTIPQALQKTIGQIKGARTETDALTAASQIWSGRTAVQMVDAVRSGKFNFDEMNKSIKGGHDSIDATAARTATLSGAMGTLRNSTEVALQPMASAVWKDINKALIDLAKNLTPVVTAMGKDLPKVMADLQPLFSLIKGEVTTVFRIWGDELKIVMPLMKALFDAISLVADLLTGKWGKAWDSLKALGNAVFAALKQIPKLLLDLVEAPFKVLGSDIDKGITDFLKRVGAIPGDIVNALASLASTVASLFTQAFTGLEGFANTAMSNFWTFVSHIPQEVLSDIASLGSDLFGALSAGFQQAYQGAVSGISGLWGWVGGITSRIIGGLGSIATDVYNWASAGFGNLLQGAQQGASAIWNWASNLGSNIASGLGNIGSALLQSGKDLIQGFINGIGSMAGSIASAISNLLPGPLKGIAHTLGLGSPSKLFYGWAKDTAQGFINGLNDSQNTVSRAFQDAFTPPMPGAVGAGGASYPGSSGPAVVVQNAHFADTLDIEAFMKKAAWVASAQKL
jgi:TP901 family phage tail tape measure protein